MTLENISSYFENKQDASLLESSSVLLFLDFLNDERTARLTSGNIELYLHITNLEIRIIKRLKKKQNKIDINHIFIEESQKYIASLKQKDEKEIKSIKNSLAEIRIAIHRREKDYKKSDIDYLTQLPQRKSAEIKFNEIRQTIIKNKTLEKRKNSNTHLAFIMFDIDKFKKINDTHGHLIGDAVLKSLAQIINKILRKEDNTLYRMSGDEFFIISKTSKKDTEIILKRIIEELNKEKIENIKVNISIGATMLNEENIANEVYSAVEERADKLLYKAKKNGRNRFAVDWK